MQQTVIMLLFCYNKTDTITRHNDGRPLYVVGDNGHDNDWANGDDDDNVVCLSVAFLPHIDIHDDERVHRRICG